MKVPHVVLLVINCRSQIAYILYTPVNWKNFFRVDVKKKDGLFECCWLLSRIFSSQLRRLSFPYMVKMLFNLITSIYARPLQIAQHPWRSWHESLKKLTRGFEEADTRVLFHVSHASPRGMSRVMIHAMDTNVTVIIAITISLSSTWVAFGAEVWYIPCHLIAAHLGLNRHGVSSSCTQYLQDSERRDF